MKITSGATTLTLVDPALMTDFQPIPASEVQQIFESYQIEGGKTKRQPHGYITTFVAPKIIYIHQASDALARAMLLTLESLIRNPNAQPFTIQWNDHVTGGPFDGQYWIEKITAAEVSSEFVGRISLGLTMTPV